MILSGQADKFLVPLPDRNLPHDSPAGLGDVMLKHAKAIWIVFIVAAMLSLASAATISDLRGAASTPATQPSSPTTNPSVNAPLSPVGEPLLAAHPEYSFLHGQQGFWRLAKSNQGVWWFVSPEDHPEFLNLVDTVQPVLHGRDPAGPDYVSTDFDAKAPDALNRWARSSVSRVLNIGFKGVGAWSSPALHQCDIPMTQDLNISAWARSSNALLFSPQWSQAAENAVKTQASPLRENHNLVGYYLDNEMDWEDESTNISSYFNNLRLDDPNRQEVLSVIHSVWQNVTAFNGDWGSNLKDWAGLSNLSSLPRASGPAYDRLGSAWLSHLADSYFKITTSLLKKYDPNHLILGVRYRGSVPIEVARASRSYTDAQSLNYYVSDAKADSDLFHMIVEESQQPLIISEYSFHALQNRSGDRNLIGFDAQVPDQEARAEAYRQLTSRLARIPYVIGADWFQWADEPSSGRDVDGEDVNFGVVDVDDHAYEPLAKAVRETTAQLDDLHTRSPSDNGSDVWRAGFNRPVAKVPYLNQPIKLDGRLNDWPAECKLQGMRVDQIVGSERNHLPTPDVYLGWTNDGLYLGFTVYDNDIEAAPASGWWWARDSVEFFIATRPPRSDQRDYDQYDHHFFFVPVDYPTMTGAAGVVGRWHTPGDAITDNLIPDPDVRQTSRVLSDRYTVEMFIPAKALRGFDPKNGSTMAFNFHARDYQHATEYFWSAPKQIQTQAHPNTWGLLNLLPPANSAPTLAGANTEAMAK
jgi:hypothetical protein